MSPSDDAAMLPDYAVLEAIGYGIYRIDGAGCCTFVNQAALDLLGYQRDELIGRNMHALIHHHRSDGSPIRQDECPLVAAAIEQRAVKLSGETLWRKDGSAFTAEYSAWPLLTSDGDRGAVVTIFDSAAQDGWRRSLELQLAVTRILTGTGEPAKIMPRVIAAIANALGLVAGVAWAVDGETLRPGAHWARDDATAALLAQGITDRVSRESVADGGWLPSTSAWSTDRSVLAGRWGTALADHIGLALTFPVLDGDTVVGMVELVGATRDEPEASLVDGLAAIGQQIGQYWRRQTIEEDLRRSQQRTSRREEEFRTLADNIPQLSWMADPSGALYWYNQRWYDYTGTDFGQMRGDGWRAVHHPDHVEAVAAKFAASVAAGEEWEDVFPLRGCDGDYRWFLSRAVPIRDARGAIARWFGTNTDITDQRRIEETLTEARAAADAANAAKSQFLANMSHELRTPLNAVIGYSEMLREDAEDAGATQMLPDLDKIHRAGRTLLSLVNDVLDLAKIEAGKMDLYLEDFAISDVVADVAATIRPLADKGGNAIVIDVAPALGTMHADLTKVRQILLNLMSNAAKFTHEGTVTLEARRMMEQGRSIARFAVTDSGIGMTPEQIGRLFQSFSQADESTTRNYGGTGLGLALSRRLAQLMGGDIAVKSEAGRGSTFTVTLPWSVMAEREEPAVPVPPAAVLANDPADPRPLVLVIDDDPAIRERLARLLDQEGLRGAYAESGEEGLALARSLRPAAITLDVMMPRIDGWKVLSRLKADAETCPIPVVMLSMVDDRSLGLALGASDFLVKPIDRDQLAAVLHRQLGDVRASVMVVEDDPSTRELLRRTLQAGGHDVIEAENGRVALDAMQRERPALILLDLLMPEMNGFEFLHAMRDTPGFDAIPVIVVTSKDLTADERAQLSGGVETVIRKGALDRDALLARVTDRLASVARAHAGTAPASDAAPTQGPSA